MKILIRDKDLLATLPAANVHKYLKSSGWRDDGHLRKRRMGALYLKDAGGQAWDVIFPYHDTVSDYALRMVETLETLAKVEARSELEIFYDILNAGPDAANGKALPALQEFSKILQAGVAATGNHAIAKTP